MSLWNLFQPYYILTQLFAAVSHYAGYFNFSFIAEPINIFFHISYLTGQLLVNKFLIISNGCLEISKLTYSFFQILYEDSLVFVKDATEKFTFAIHLLKECYLFLEEGVQTASEFVFNIFKIVIKLVGAFASLLGFLHHTISTTIQNLSLLGSTIWHSIISIPETLIFSIYAVTGFIKNTINDMINSFFILCDEASWGIKKTYRFLFNIPLDSIYGILVGGVLMVVLCIKFKDICLITSSALLKLYQCTISLSINLWTGRFLERRVERTAHHEYNPEDDERLCVICQYQSKEIIIFPCKHLCLCGDCSSQLTKNQHTCPICRSRIKGTLKVYL